jgi:hypothetical protein
MQHFVRATSALASLGIAAGIPFITGNLVVLSVPQAAGGSSTVAPSLIEFQSGVTSSVVQTINVASGVGDLQANVLGGKLHLSADGSMCF